MDKSPFYDDNNTVDEKLKRADREFKSYRKVPFSARKEKMLAVAGELRKDREKYSRMISEEMGKPIRESRSEIDKCDWVCDYYADISEEFLQDEVIETDADKSFVRYDPLGVILAVMPWNFPFWQVFRFAAPTIMAGNTAVLKHSSLTQGSGALIEELFFKAGFPKGVFQNLSIPSSSVERVMRNPIIKGVSVTGSGKAGSSVASVCGEEIKTTVLELGGSNSFIVFPDADLNQAAKLGVRARMINNGQSCIASKRFILHRDIADEYIKKYIAVLEKLKVGDPLEEDTEVGPMASEEQAEKLEDQLRRSVDAGAKLLCGGSRSGRYFKPAVLAGVKPGMPAFDEEIFGPVAAMIVVDDIEEAIELSNRSEYGLGVTLATSDIDRALEISKSIEDGAVFINELVKSDPRLPFGGTKKSGYGRELSRHGIREFVNAKTVFVKKSIS